MTFFEKKLRRRDSGSDLIVPDLYSQAKTKEGEAVCFPEGIAAAIRTYRLSEEIIELVCNHKDLQQGSGGFKPNWELRKTIKNSLNGTVSMLAIGIWEPGSVREGVDRSPSRGGLDIRWQPQESNNPSQFISINLGSKQRLVMSAQYSGRGGVGLDQSLHFMRYKDVLENQRFWKDLAKRGIAEQDLIFDEHLGWSIENMMLLGNDVFEAWWRQERKPWESEMSNKIHHSKSRITPFLEKIMERLTNEQFYVS